MERLRRAVQAHTARTRCAAFAVTTAFSLLSPRDAHAQAPSTPSAASPSTVPSPAPVPADAANPAEIVAARELFRQGTEDADAGRFAEGLEKFKRVAAVKETAAVRFNIARCEEALGKTGTALGDFELAAREGGDAKAEDVAKLAAQRADALRPRVPRLTVVPPTPSAPDGMSVTLDGGKLANATLAVGLPVDPGSHVVDATAPGRFPFHAELSLAAGDTKSVTLALPLERQAAGDKPVDPKPEPGSSSQGTVGWVAVAAGGAFAIGSGVFLALQRSAVSSVNTDCPNPSACPAQKQQDVNGLESNARAYAGASVGLLAGGVLAIGVGAVLVATAPKSGSPAVTVTMGATGTPAGLTLRASF